MGKVPDFYVDPDLCTECDDCIKAMPTVFRKADGEDVAEAYNTDVDDSKKPELDKIMEECPGHAILWRK